MDEIGAMIREGEGRMLQRPRCVHPNVSSLDMQDPATVAPYLPASAVEAVVVAAALALAREGWPVTAGTIGSVIGVPAYVVASLYAVAPAPGVAS